MAGRKRKPTELKRKQGTLRPCRENPSEVKPEICIPDIPEFIRGNDRAVQIWNRLAPQLERDKLLTDRYAEAFGRYCFWQARFEELAQNQNIFPSQLKDAELQISRLSSRFGFTPADISEIKNLPKGKEKNPFEEMMNQGRNKNAG
jgi:phage terminase small subunit